MHVRLTSKVRYRKKKKPKKKITYVACHFALLHHDLPVLLSGNRELPAPSLNCALLPGKTAIRMYCLYIQTAGGFIKQQPEQ